MILSISWKNIWRNRIRSSVVIAAFVFGIFAGIFAAAVMIGAIDQRINNAIGNETSHIQIHHPYYLENNELKYTIDDYQVLVDSILQLPEVEAVSPRVKVMGMASTSGNATGVLINGVEAASEKMVSGIAGAITAERGTFLDGHEKKPIVIGEKLARTLKISYYELNENDLKRLKENRKINIPVIGLDSLVGMRFRTENEFDQAIINVLGKSKAVKYAYYIKKEAVKYRLNKKVVLSFQSLDGHIAYDAFKVVGIYKLNVYVLKNDISPVAFLAVNQVNEIAVRLSGSNFDRIIAERIKSIAPGLSVEIWKDILPEARIYTEMMDFYLIIFLVIILLALGFGIVNTMLMAVLERVKEIGMLMAIGMNKSRVFIMIMLETIFLGLTGSVIGMVISYLVILYSGNTGIDLSRLYQEGFEAMGFDANLYPAIGFGTFIEVTILVILTGIIASIYPARKAIKLKPSEAIRIDM
jgi:ABC-type lipoprotein release transport system permease subunit